MVAQITDRLHVSASWRDVVRAARSAIRPEFYVHLHRAGRRAFYRACLVRHQENKRLYRQVMGS